VQDVLLFYAKNGAYVLIKHLHRAYTEFIPVIPELWISNINNLLLYAERNANLFLYQLDTSKSYHCWPQLSV